MKYVVLSAKDLAFGKKLNALRSRYFVFSSPGQETNEQWNAVLDRCPPYHWSHCQLSPTQRSLDSRSCIRRTSFKFQLVTHNPSSLRPTPILFTTTTSKFGSSRQYWKSQLAPLCGAAASGGGFVQQQELRRGRMEKSQQP